MDEAGNQLPYIDRDRADQGRESRGHQPAGNRRRLRPAGTPHRPHQAAGAAREPGGRRLHGPPRHLEHGRRGLSSASTRPTRSIRRRGSCFANADFRRALSLGIDRDAINEVLFLGLGTPGSIAPREGTIFSPGPDSEWRTKWSTYEPDKANAHARRDRHYQERDADGYRLLANGKRLSVELMTYVAFMNYTALGEMIAEDFKDLGIEVEVVEMERTASQTRRRANESELTIDTDLGRREHLRPSDARSGRSRPTRASGRSTAGRSPARARKASSRRPRWLEGRRALPVRDLSRRPRSVQSSFARSGASSSINSGRSAPSACRRRSRAFASCRTSWATSPTGRSTARSVDNPAGSRPEQFYFKN